MIRSYWMCVCVDSESVWIGTPCQVLTAVHSQTTLAEGSLPCCDSLHWALALFTGSLLRWIKQVSQCCERYLFPNASRFNFAVPLNLILSSRGTRRGLTSTAVSFFSAENRFHCLFALLPSVSSGFYSVDCCFDSRRTGEQRLNAQAELLMS